ncbi:response regulator [Candidatus Pacebacteria bacterium]|nr:response regulator [Candidatus Paceibacterota bacterium]
MPENNVAEALEEYGGRELGDVKILMVEDDRFFTKLVLNKLSENGCIPYSTGQGDEAMKLASQYQPNLIILDLMLPGMSGEDILRTLKANDQLKDIPVVIFSNKSNQVDIDNNLQLGAAEFLVKSTTDLADLIEVVKRLAKK